MLKKKAYEELLHELCECKLFTGVYDAKNGNESFMHGVWMVMESIAGRVSEEALDEFDAMFTKNLIESEERARK